MEIYYHRTYGPIFEQNCKSIPVLKPMNEKYIIPAIDYGGDIDLVGDSVNDLKEERN